MARVAELSATVTAETGDFERGLSNVEKAISGTRTTIGGLDKDIKIMGRNMGSASDAMRGMGISLPITPMAALGQGVAMVGSAIKDSINTTLAWADSMDKLARNTGTSTEEASEMAVVFGYFGVQAGQLEMALKSLNAKGIALNTESLGELAAEYRSIKDPVAQLAFATEHFGRAAQDMTEILSKTPDELRELGEAARASGKIMSGEAVDAAQELKLEMAKLDAQVDGLKISMGGPLVGALSHVSESVGNNADAWNRDVKAIRLWINANALRSGGISEATYETRRLAIETEGLTRAQINNTDGNASATKTWRQLQDAQAATLPVTRDLTKAFRDHDIAMEAMAHGGESVGRAFAFTYDAAMLLEMGMSGRLQDATEDYNKTMAETTLAIDEYHKAMAEGGKAAEAAAGTLEGLIAQQGLAEDAIRKATAEIILQQVAMNLGKEGALEFAHATGIMSDADYELAKAIQRATNAADLNKNGIIDLGKEQDILLDLTLKLTDETGDLATGTATATSNMGELGESFSPVITGLSAAATMADTLRNALDGIPRDISIAIQATYTSIGDESFGGWTAPAGPPAGGGGGTGPASPPAYTPPPGMNAPGGMRGPSGPSAPGGNGTTINLVVNNFVAPVAGATLLQTARAVAGAMG